MVWYRLPTQNTLVFHCHISFIFQTILLLLLFAKPSIKLFFYATIWTLFVQEAYYISELVNYYYKKDYTKPLQNIAWSSSVYILSYWIFRYVYHWPDKSPMWLEILMHGLNSALIILCVRRLNHSLIELDSSFRSMIIFISLLIYVLRLDILI